MKKGEEISLTIDSLSGDGRAVARRDGIVCFVDNAVPGDTVRAIIKKVKKNFTEAKAVEILTPSIHRTQPQCKHFGICGGCRWQNLSYDAQLRFKRQMVIDTFSRIGKFDHVDVLPIIGCENSYYYRNKMEFTFSNHRWLTDDEMLQGIEMKKEIALGLHVPNRYDKVMNVEECWLQSELSSAVVNFIREVCRVWELEVYSTRTHEGYLRHLVIREGKRTSEVMVNLVTTSDIPEVMNNLTKLLIKQFPEITTVVNNITERKSMVAIGESEKVYHGKGYITET
ncbi:MAG TPA: TRAM domain-containing protein, partial [Bacteroidota bacterium]|nr:TRAM domain-containing protein [Bacteroidota bacterium]